MATYLPDFAIAEKKRRKAAANERNGIATNNDSRAAQ
jgi:hypothetical protein